MKWPDPRYVQAPADVAGAGGATTEQAQGADSGTSVTPPAGAAGAADSKQAGGTEDKKSMLSGSGADRGDASKDGKESPKGADQDASAAEKPAPVKITLPEKIPDGVTVDKDYVAAFEAQATALGLDSDEASGLVAWYFEQEGQRVTKSNQDLNQWSKEQYDLLTRDPEFGGKNLAESQANVQKALVRFGKPYGLVERLEALHLENDPAIVKMLAAVGRALSEDRSRTDQATKPAMSVEEEREAKLFPSHVELRKRLGQTGT
jgi:hypothetical protein